MTIISKVCGYGLWEVGTLLCSYKLIVVDCTFLVQNNSRPYSMPIHSLRSWQSLRLGRFLVILVVLILLDIDRKVATPVGLISLCTLFAATTILSSIWS